MRAHVVAAALATAELGEPRQRRASEQGKDRRGRAERLRFTERDLEELFGDMQPAPPPPPPIAPPEPNFIAWDPAIAVQLEPACGQEPPLAA